MGGDYPESGPRLASPAQIPAYAQKCAHYTGTVADVCSKKKVQTGIQLTGCSAVPYL